jgi:hypothetical protein
MKYFLERIVGWATVAILFIFVSATLAWYLGRLVRIFLNAAGL